MIFTRSRGQFQRQNFPGMAWKTGAEKETKQFGPRNNDWRTMTADSIQ